MSAGKKVYGLVKWVMVALIISVFINTATAAVDVSRLQWATGIVSDKLHLGEKIQYNGYTVEVEVLPPAVESDKYSDGPVEPVDGYVGLNITRNGIRLNTTVLGLGESFILPNGDLKITAKQFPSRNSSEWVYENYYPWAVIDIQPRGIPNLEISIETESEEYVSSYATEINAVVTMKNTGTADISNVDVIIKTELPLKRGFLKYHFDTIIKGDTITKSITFSAPIVTEQKTYGILANMTGYDAMDAFYKAESVRSISILTEPPVSLSIRKSTNEKVYLKDLAIVSLSITNNGKYDLKNVSISDSLPNEFKLTSNFTLHWITDIAAGGYWDFHYLIKPLEANKDGIALPAATAEFRYKNEYYFVQSNQPVIAVYGPKIVVNKQTDVTEINPGDSVTVTIVVENQGSTLTKVSTMDVLPETATLISGNTAHEDILEANKQVSFSYTIRIDSTQAIRLPAAKADYFELGTQGSKINTVSQQPEIKIKSREVVPEATPDISSNNAPAPEPSTPEPTPMPTPEVTPEPAPVDEIQISYGIRNEEVDSLLNFMLGCGEGNNTSPTANAACKFYGQNTSQ